MGTLHAVLVRQIGNPRRLPGGLGAMRQKIGAFASGSRYLSPSQKMFRANVRRRRAAEQNGNRARSDGAPE